MTNDKDFLLRHPTPPVGLKQNLRGPGRHAPPMVTADGQKSHGEYKRRPVISPCVPGRMLLPKKRT
jgi:hypothetical protein